ncbi:MAG: hypothetical protein ABSG70_18225 [Terriglobales bacterium]
MRKIRLLFLTLLILATPATLFAQFGISITIAPPELVAYSQPICPQDGYLWAPGYWAYGEEGYFWVPGTWAEPPAIGLLWTPGYWGWGGNAFAWNEGYWGPTIGFYGGVNYGFGYGGVGYEGGYWNNGAFSYNRSVNNVDVTNIHNTYEKTVINERAGNTVSYNGGTGGTTARPTAAEETASHERHTPATAAQTGHQQAASKNHELLASVNHGKPPIAATSKPGEFTGKGAVAAKGAATENKATENKAAENKAAETKATENKAAENKAAETKASENKAAENKAAETKASENKAAENKAAATRSNENKGADSPQAARQQSAPQTAAPKESAPRPGTAARAQPAPKAAPRAEPAPPQEKKEPGGKEEPRR